MARTAPVTFKGLLARLAYEVTNRVVAYAFAAECTKCGAKAQKWCDISVPMFHSARLYRGASRMVDDVYSKENSYDSTV